MPPSGFSEEFLDWFRATTEGNWAAMQLRYFAGTEFARFGSATWQQRARWLNGMSNESIDQLEYTWAVHFPPDYRLFLHRLHAPDRPLGATRSDAGHVPSIQQPFFSVFGFYNWFLDHEQLRESFNWPLDGLLFDIDHNDLWHQSWGAKPPTLDARKACVRELVAQAPKLIPINGHRYLLAEPCQAGNPVLSVYQSDIIVYGGDLRDYFFHEYGYYLSPEAEPALLPETTARPETIPFWGEFL